MMKFARNPAETSRKLLDRGTDIGYVTVHSRFQANEVRRAYREMRAADIPIRKVRRILFDLQFRYWDTNVSTYMTHNKRGK